MNSRSYCLYIYVYIYPIKKIYAHLGLCLHYSHLSSNAFCSVAVFSAQPQVWHCQSTKEVLVDDLKVGGNLYRRRNHLINQHLLWIKLWNMVAGWMWMRGMERYSCDCTCFFWETTMLPRLHSVFPFRMSCFIFFINLFYSFWVGWGWFGIDVTWLFDLVCMCPMNCTFFT